MSDLDMGATDTTCMREEADRQALRRHPHPRRAHLHTQDMEAGDSIIEEAIIEEATAVAATMDMEDIIITIMESIAIAAARPLAPPAPPALRLDPPSLYRLLISPAPMLMMPVACLLQYARTLITRHIS